MVVAAAFNLSGCADKDRNRPTEVLNGVPISVSESFAQYNGYVSIVLESEGKKVLATSLGYSSPLLNAKAEALVQSEINDNDQESIGLLGYFEGNEFKFKRLMANDYTLNFE